LRFDNSGQFGNGIGKRAKNAKVITGWRRKGIFAVISPQFGNASRSYPALIVSA
jgi:hypothetical protein